MTASSEAAVGERSRLSTVTASAPLPGPLTPRDRTSPGLRAAKGLAVGLLPSALALGLTLQIQQLFPYPFLILFLGAVIVSSWVGGLGPGVLSVLASSVSVDYFFIPPVRSFSVSPAAEAYLVAFVVCALVASGASSAKRRTEAAVRQARDELEVRVAQRTAEIQQSNAELRERERQLRLLTEVIPQQVWSATADGAIDYCNSRLLDYVGGKLEEMRGAGLLETVHPDDRERFRSSWRAAVSAGAPFEGEWRVRDGEGDYRRFFTRAMPLRRADGQVLRWYGTNTDIEEHQQAEQALFRTQAELAHLSRVLTMGELTTSIAHEMNQPLTAVIAHGYACLGWLAATPPNVERVQESVERIIEDGTRAGAVLGRIRALFRKEDVPRAAVDMTEVIGELTRFLADEASRRGVSIRAALAPNLPGVVGDRVQLHQVVLNLAMNALDALESHAGAKEILISASLHAPGEILVCIEDTGHGLAPEVSRRMFEPFFTTKPHGLGMGLSISRSIVESHAGRLWATGREGGGASLRFTLPADPRG
ncbi:MAG TPA: ATP-binding protein [Gemmatimonadales bacterium]|nr:ATP-binding protein [Gemmatimonadales bacterium]